MPETPNYPRNSETKDNYKQLDNDYIIFNDIIANDDFIEDDDIIADDDFIEKDDIIEDDDFTEEDDIIETEDQNHNVEQLPNEIYKPILNYESRFKVSNFGNVISMKTNKILKVFKNNQGYLTVTLDNPEIDKYAKKFYIHNLVISTFVERPQVEYKLYIDHIDGDKLNNKLDNLRWVSQSENIINAYKNNPNFANVNKSVSKMNYEGKVIKTYKSLTEAAKDHGTNRISDIAACCKGKKETYLGYKWKYNEEIYKPELKDDEIFKPIDEFFGEKFISDREVSNYGKIRNSKTGIYLKPCSTSGYDVIQLRSITNKRFTVAIHRLVAYFHIKKETDKSKIVNHKDENKLNNHYENLEWMSQRENIIYSMGKRVYQYQINNGKQIRSFNCLADAYSHLELNHTRGIGEAAAKEAARYGYKWSFEDKEYL